MKRRTLKPGWALALAIVVGLSGASPGRAQVPPDAIETLREDLRVDRKVVVAQKMLLTQQESDAFWPIYRKYRADVDKVTDRLVELVLEFVDSDGRIPEAKAGQMLNRYMNIESDLLGVKRKYLKKMAKVLPASKVLAFAQLDNRLDLGTRIALAGILSLVPQAQTPSAEKLR